MSKRNINKSFGVIQGGNYDDIKINGFCNIEDDIVCDTIIVSGCANFSGDIKCDDIRINGAVNIEGDVKADTLEIRGTVNANNIETEKFMLYGAANINGDINTDELDAKTISIFRNIYGEKIIIKGTKFNHNIKVTINSDFKNVGNSSQLSQFNEIEATTIELSYIKGNRISGEKITIGDMVEIDTVEYTDSISINSNAKINKIIKL